MFNIVPNRGGVEITFWNPYDLFNGSLSNRRQTFTNTAPALDAFSGGWENFELSSGKYYFEIDLQQLDFNGLNNAMQCGWRNAQDGMPGSDTTRVIYLGPNCHQIASWGSDIGTKIQGSNTLTTDNTNEFGYAEGDRLMFALDLDNAKAWVGKNGTWMNSGNPAAGTNPQWTGFLSGRSYRFWISGRGFTNAIINACFGGTIFPQLYAAPSGFSNLIAKAETQVYGGWSVRLSSAEWQQPDNTLVDTNWQYGLKLFTNGNAQWSVSAGRMRVGEKFYQEFRGINQGGSVLYSLGCSTLGNSVADCEWREDGTLTTTGGVTSDNTGVGVWSTALDRVAIAVDVSAGKVWLRNRNGSWANGDPSTGTGEQFANCPVAERSFWGEVSDYSGTLQLFQPADFIWSTPTGFQAGLPLHPLGLQ